MERLTRRMKNGTAYLTCYEPLEKAIERLAEYEDIGLEPEEIMKMKRAWHAVCIAQI